MPRTIDNIMRIITKEFKVYNYNELNQEAKDKAINWISASDFYNSVTSDNATAEAEYVAKDYLNTPDADLYIEWDTCSAGFIRQVKVSVNNVELDNDALEAIISRELQAVIDYDQSLEVLEAMLVDNEYLFTKNGKFYRD